MKFKSFGPFRRILGNSVLQIDVPSGSTVEDVIASVIEIGGPKLKQLIMDGERISGNLIVMLNKRDVNTIGGLEVPINTDDEIALLPHVQGG